MKKVMKRLAVLAAAGVLALSVFSLAGCGGGSGEGSGSGGSGGGETTPDATPTPAPAPEPKGASYAITDKRAVTWVNSIGTTWVQVIVEITNDGTKDLYLGSGKVDLEDANGKLIKSISLVSEVPEVLAPGEKGYMYEETTLDNPVEGAITVLPREDVKEAKVDRVRLAVSEVELSDSGYGDIKALGRVENTTDETQDWVNVEILLFDADGKLIGKVTSLITDELKPGDKVGFEATSFSLPDTVTVSSVASFIAYAYPMQMQF